MSTPSSLPSLAIFLGGVGGSPVEEWMRGVLEAAALDLAEAALASSVFGRVVLAADRAPAGDVPASLDVRVDAEGESGGAFRFGEAFVPRAGSPTSARGAGRSWMRWSSRRSSRHSRRRVPRVWLSRTTDFRPTCSPSRILGVSLISTLPP